SEEAARRFHQQLNAEQYKAICADAVEGFCSGDEHEDLVKILRVVHKKLGDAGESKFVRINVNARTDGTFTTAVYETKFTKGDATETFTWIKRKGGLRLHSYNINSMALVVD